MVEKTEPKYKFKGKSTARDFVNSVSPKLKEGLLANIRMAAKDVTPKLTKDKILDMPYKAYQEFMSEYFKANGITDDSLE